MSKFLEGESFHLRPVLRPMGEHAPRILILQGSLRPKSYSRLLAAEAGRILESMGAEIRTFDSRGLPLFDQESHAHEKVRELRDLSIWSEGHVWVSPEMHGRFLA